MSGLLEIKPGISFQIARLKELLPDTETLLFFAKLYKLTPGQLGNLLLMVQGDNDVIHALLAESSTHSLELQDYLIEIGYGDLIERGLISLTDVEPKGEILPQLWKSFEIEIADSIQKVLDKLGETVTRMPGKQGEMLFKSLAVMNAKRPVIGDYRAVIHHAPQKENLLVFDVSGSMSESTVSKIVEDVVALAWTANMHLVIVSDTATHWAPGEFTVAEVLNAAEYCGTHYEKLAPLFDRDWGVVVTIADYDSSPAAKAALKQASGHIDLVLDISLVSKPTYLSEVLGVLADEVRPILVAQNDYVCMQ